MKLIIAVSRQYFQILCVVLVLGGILIIGCVAVLTLSSRQAAISAADNSAANNPFRPTISIYRAKNESDWRVLAYGDPADWHVPPFVYKLDGGWIVRIDVENKKVEAVLSQGYWRDLINSKSRAMALIGGMVACLAGIVLGLRKGKVSITEAR